MRYRRARAGSATPSDRGVIFRWSPTDPGSDREAMPADDQVTSDIVDFVEFRRRRVRGPRRARADTVRPVARAQTITPAQVQFASWSMYLLIDIIVLNLFVEFSSAVVIDSFYISILTAAL